MQAEREKDRGLVASKVFINFLSTQVKYLLDEFLERLPESFNMLDLHGKVDEKTPYVLVALQECERMNTLTDEIRRSLKELDLGLKVQWRSLIWHK